MGLIMILLKLKYSQTKDFNVVFSSSSGMYDDITTGWYEEIGVVILLTLGINIMIPFMEMMFLSMLKCLRKCIDRRCYCRKTSQKTKKGYMELYAGDVFPIE